MSPRVVIAGCGLIGRKRRAALGDATLVACVDPDLNRAREIANTAPHVRVAKTIDELRLNVDLPADIAIVATTNDQLVDVSCQALRAGCHVLVEKPSARSTTELDKVIAAAASTGKLVRVGFNHRYHPASLKAKQIIDDGLIGSIFLVRARYGHGGRVGYEREWRANPAISGGGELIDQGIHLIDLARWFLQEDFSDIQGFATTLYWNMTADDNAFLTLRTDRGATAFLHASCSEWKNLFSIEIYGRQGKLHLEGLGGSYGLERLSWYQMRPEMGPPDTSISEFPGPDESWHVEFREFLDDIKSGRPPSASVDDARKALAIVERIYANGVNRIAEQQQ